MLQFAKGIARLWPVEPGLNRAAGELSDQQVELNLLDFFQQLGVIPALSPGGQP